MRGITLRRMWGLLTIGGLMLLGVSAAQGQSKTSGPAVEARVEHFTLVVARDHYGAGEAVDAMVILPGAAQGVARWEVRIATSDSALSEGAAGVQCSVRRLRFCIPEDGVWQVAGIAYDAKGRAVAVSTCKVNVLPAVSLWGTLSNIPGWASAAIAGVGGFVGARWLEWRRAKRAARRWFDDALARCRDELLSGRSCSVPEPIQRPEGSPWATTLCGKPYVAARAELLKLVREVEDGTRLKSEAAEEVESIRLQLIRPGPAGRQRKGSSSLVADCTTVGSAADSHRSRPS